MNPVDWGLSEWLFIAVIVTVAFFAWKNQDKVKSLFSGGKGSDINQRRK